MQRSPLLVAAVFILGRRGVEGWIVAKSCELGRWKRRQVWGADRRPEDTQYAVIVGLDHDKLGLKASCSVACSSSMYMTRQVGGCSAEHNVQSRKAWVSSQNLHRLRRGSHS